MKDLALPTEFSGTVDNVDNVDTVDGADLPAAPEAFCIDSEDRANWYLRKRAGIAAERARVQAQAAARIAELDADDAALTRRFGSQFEAWARQEAARRRRQTVTLMQGTVAFRQVAPTLRVASQADAITTARAVCPDAVTEETVTKLDAAALLKAARAHFEATGELLPGIERTEGRESVSVKFPGAPKEAAPTE